MKMIVFLTRQLRCDPELILNVVYQVWIWFKLGLLVSIGRIRSDLKSDPDPGNTADDVIRSTNINIQMIKLNCVGLSHSWLQVKVLII